MLEISLEEQQVILLKEKAIYWPAEKTIIVADLHWGKTAHFRKNGIAIPMNAQHSDEVRLSAIIREHNAERLIVAGDMFHSRENNETDNFSHWRNEHSSLTIDLVTGNHDILSTDKYESWKLNILDEKLDIGPFIITHDEASTDKYCIHGHMHPSYKMGGGRHASIKLPCFCQGGTRFVLPAFGSFTGTKLVSDRNYRHLYVITDNEVIMWK